MASKHLGDVVSFAATSVQVWGSKALAYAQENPARAGIMTVSVGLSPFLGTGWMIALPLKAIGFSQAGVGAGKP